MNRKRKAPATRVNVEPATATTTKSRRSDKDAAEALLDLYTKALEHKEKTAIEGLTSLGNPVLKANTADFMTFVDSSSDVLPEECSPSSGKGHQNILKDVSVQVLKLSKPV